MRGCGRIVDAGGYTVNGRRPGRLAERSPNLTASRGMVTTDHTHGHYMQPDTGHTMTMTMRGLWHGHAGSR